jgi:hypothetical protein
LFNKVGTEFGTSRERFVGHSGFWVQLSSWSRRACLGRSRPIGQHSSEANAGFCSSKTIHRCLFTATGDNSPAQKRFISRPKHCNRLQLSFLTWPASRYEPGPICLSCLQNLSQLFSLIIATNQRGASLSGPLGKGNFRSGRFEGDPCRVFLVHQWKWTLPDQHISPLKFERMNKPFSKAHA